MVATSTGVWSGTSARRRWTRAAGLVVAVLVLASGCNSTTRLGSRGAGHPTLSSLAAAGAGSDARGDQAADEGSGASPATAPGASGGPGGTRTATTARGAGGGPAGGSGGGRSDVNTTQSGPGVTDTEVRVGFVLPDTEALSTDFGIVVPNQGDLPQQVKDLEDWFNRNGGIAGRRVVAFGRPYNTRQASVANENQLCRAFTEDDKVFAVVLQAQIHEATRTCYAQHKVLVLDPSPFPYDKVLYDKLAPYYWSPSYPEYAKTVRALVRSAKARGYFDDTGMKLGIAYFDIPAYVRVLDTVLLPELKAVGVVPTEKVRVDPQDAGTIQAGLNDAILRFRASSVAHVMFLGGAPLAPFFQLNAEGQQYFPRYALTTFDAPRFTEQNYPDQLKGMVGVGTSPGGDVSDGQFAFPNAELPLEKTCIGILTAKGRTYRQRADSRSAQAYCESLFLIKAGAEAAGRSITPVTWGAAVEKFGDKVQMASTWRVRFGPGQHDGAATFRPYAFDDRCRCVRYTGGTQAFEG